MIGPERLEAVAADLERAGEELADVAMDVLRQALEFEGDEAIAAARETERLLNRARAAVEKAARLARTAAGRPSGDLPDD